MSDESEAGAEASAASAVDRGVRLATPPSDKLVTITTNMNTNLTALLSILQVRHHHKGCDSFTHRDRAATPGRFFAKRPLSAYLGK